MQQESERERILTKVLHRPRMRFVLQQRKEDILRLVIDCVKLISGNCVGQQKPQANWVAFSCWAEFCSLFVFLCLELGLDLDGLNYCMHPVSAAHHGIRPASNPSPAWSLLPSPVQRVRGVRGPERAVRPVGGGRGVRQQLPVHDPLLPSVLFPVHSERRNRNRKRIRNRNRR